MLEKIMKCLKRETTEGRELSNSKRIRTFEKKKLQIFKIIKSVHHQIRRNGWLVGWLVWFYGISTFVSYLTPNPFLYI